MVFVLCGLAGSVTSLTYAKAPAGCMDDCVGAQELCITGLVTNLTSCVSNCAGDLFCERYCGEGTRDAAKSCASSMKSCVILCAPGRPEHKPDLTSAGMS